jgi:quercetin dioxygenase-like cupin family protein
MGRKWKVILASAIVAAAGVTIAHVALATTPSGQVGTILGRGTTDRALKYTVPKVVTVTQKVRVKVKGKYVIRKKKVQKTIDSPIVACSTSTPCDVVQQKITYAPGGFSGWHSHPGVVLAVLLSGTITRYTTDCAHTTYNAGQTFVELGHDETMLIRNEGSTPAEVLATLIVPAGTSNAELRIDQPQPSGCAP